MSGELRQYPPTARRLSRLRQAGIFPRSQVLTTAAVLGVLLVVIAVLSPRLLSILAHPFSELLSSAGSVASGEALTLQPVLPVGIMAAGLLVLIWLTALGVSALQRGTSPGGEAPGRVPFGGPEVSFRRSRVADLAWELVVSAVILFGGAIIIYGQLTALANLPTSDPSALGGALQGVIWAFAWRLGLLMVGLGLCDYLYQRAIFSQAAAMTRYELQQEVRETEGPWLVRWWQQRRMRRR